MASNKSKKSIQSEKTIIWFSCKYCDAAYQRKDSLQKHTSEKHLKDVYDFRCPYDQIDFSSLKTDIDLRKHIDEKIRVYKKDSVGSKILDRQKIKEVVLMILRQTYLSNEHPECHNIYIRCKDTRSTFNIYNGEKWVKEGTIKIIEQLLLTFLNVIDDLLTDDVIRMLYRGHLSAWLEGLDYEYYFEHERYNYIPDIDATEEDQPTKNHQDYKDYIDLIHAIHKEIYDCHEMLYYSYSITTNRTEDRTIAKSIGSRLYHTAKYFAKKEKEEEKEQEKEEKDESTE